LPDQNEEQTPMDVSGDVADKLPADKLPADQKEGEL
jgi:hypothetical protein